MEQGILLYLCSESVDPIYLFTSTTQLKNNSIKERMDFIASLLPVAITVGLSMRTARLILEPNSYISFFGLFWVPYHDDLPFRFLIDCLVCGCIYAVLSLLAPRFPRLLKAYNTGASPNLPWNGGRLLPNKPLLEIAFITITLCGRVGNSMGMSLPYRFIVGLAQITLLAALIFYILVKAAMVRRVYIQFYPEKPPPGLVTGMLWPPLHPIRRFLMRTSNKFGRLFENSNPSVAAEPRQQ